MSKNDSIKRNALVSLEMEIGGQGRKDPLDIMWATKWRLDDLINKMGLYVRENAEVIKYARTKDDKDKAINALMQLSTGIRQLSSAPLYNEDDMPVYIVFPYEHTAYRITIIEEESK